MHGTLAALLFAGLSTAALAQGAGEPQPAGPAGITSESLDPPPTPTAVPVAGSPAELRAAAEARYLEGDTTGALALYRALVERLEQPVERAEVLITIAWLEHAGGADASADMLAALRLAPDVPFAPQNYEQPFVDLYDAARQQVAAERQQAAGERVREGLAALERGDLATADAALGAALAIQPDQPTALYNKALVALRRNDVEAAITGFERLLSVAAASAVSPELRASALNNLAVLYYGKGFYSDAESAVRRALELAPGDARAWSNLGLALRRQQRGDEAIAAFRRALELAPADDSVAVNLGLAYLDRGSFAEAAAVLGARTREAAAGPAVWLHLGIARRGLGDLAGAAEAFRRTLELDPENAAGAARAAAFLALTAHDMGDDTAAIEAARRAIAWNGADVESWTYLGLAQQALGDLGGARESFERAAALDPQRAEIANNLGTVLYELGDLAGAETAFSRALELRPGFPQATTNLANVRQAQADRAAAVAATGTDSAGRRRVDLGARVSPVNLEAVGIRGLRLEAVSPHGAAGAAGLRKGDLVLLVDGRAVASQADLDAALAAATTDAVQLDMLREGRPMRVQVKLR